jgi:hypothetical protein
MRLLSNQPKSYSKPILTYPFKGWDNMMNNDSLFIEQAEYITPSDFIEWSSDHPNEDIIINWAARMWKNDINAQSL